MLERPTWAAALRAAVETGICGVGEEELLLSAGAYHSPLALVTGEFGLAYRGGGRLPIARTLYLPLFECRWARHLPQCRHCRCG